jgi:hypothetical protein
MIHIICEISENQREKMPGKGKVIGGISGIIEI